jgi:hypothetical protein
MEIIRRRADHHELGVLHDIRRIYLDGIGHTSVRTELQWRFVGTGKATPGRRNQQLRAGTIDRNGIPYSDKLTAVERIRG